MFVEQGLDQRKPVQAMPGVSRLPIAAAVSDAGEALALGIPGVILFGIPAEKDAEGSGGLGSATGSCSCATRAIKEAHPELIVISDLCLCEYTDHGHCGVLTQRRRRRQRRDARAARQDRRLARARRRRHHRAERHDGRPRRCDPRRPGRAWLQRHADSRLLGEVRLRFYGPFREAAGSTPSFGDRHGYQMDPANAAEALRETRLDIEEGADMVMVKPALPYLDVIRRVKDDTSMPLVAYSVSGEYAMLKAASAAGYLDERAAVLEALTAIRRAGADVVITYYAIDAARWLA